MLTRIDLRGESIDDLAVSAFETLDLEESRRTVREIIGDVRNRGDVALRELAKKFDGAEIDAIAVPPSAISAAANSVPAKVANSLNAAANRITEYQRSQLQQPRTHIADGIAVTDRSVAVKSAGLYVPGGKAAYPSTVLMTAIPARVAGVENIAVCVPPDATGEVSPATLAAAKIAGVDIVYRIGGAGAIAALAYGTESVAPVDVIAGPGNIYVALAQQEVAGLVGVASGFAGPSEIAVIADDTASPEFAAADLLTQAEHGPSGRAWLISPSEEVLRSVEQALAEQLAASPRRSEAEATLSESGYGVLVDDIETAAEAANKLAPEHVQLMCADAENLAQSIRNAGAVFCGELSPAVIGDYIAGPSHVLPTGGTARFASGLQATDFQKRLHTISVSPEGFAAVGETVAALAEAEGLMGHRDAVLARLADMPAEASSPKSEAPSKIGFLRHNIVDLKSYHSPQLDVEVRLNTNESPYPPPEGFEEAVAEAIGGSSWNRYPQRTAQSLCSALGEFHDLPANQIFAANGSNEVIQTLLMCYGGAGRKVAVFQPTYALHSHIARSLSSELVVGERMPDFALDLEKTADLIRRERPSVVFLCSPNNPTGLADSNESVSAVLEQTAAVGGLLVVDEAYAEFAPETALDLLEESSPLVVTRTYSKTWAMAAARLGYLAGPSQLVADLEKAALPYRLNSVTQAVGEIALSFREEMAVRVSSIKSERARICAGLDDLGVRYWHSDANFILFRGDLGEKASWQASPEALAGDTDRNLADIPEGDPLWRRLVARSVLVRDCSSWPGLSGCLRVTVGTPEENSRFLSALSAIL